jgi:ArsR family transcriptional regulator, lead/cadmium/zinc/bismuth-responsive transcriptional repressor
MNADNSCMIVQVFSERRKFVKSIVAHSAAAMASEDVCQEHLIHAEHVQEVRRTVLSSKEATHIAAFFAVLSDPTRLQVVHALLSAPSGELCVCDLACSLGRDDTTISHQLRVLRNQHVVSMRKVGRVVYYRLVDEHIRQLLLMSMAHTREVFTASGAPVASILSGVPVALEQEEALA